MRRLDQILLIPTSLALFACVVTFPLAVAKDRSGLAPKELSVSPQLKIKHPTLRAARHGERTDYQKPPTPFRTFDGSNNNPDEPKMGSSFVNLVRWIRSDYEDGISALAGSERKNPREISNIVADQPTSRPNRLRASDYLWQWGQFVDHDIDLTEGIDPAEPADIKVPENDEHFTGSVIPFNRSIYDPNTGTDDDNPRQQLNEITAWIDASNVYGSDEVRARALRKLDGTGQLKTSSGNLLPFNVDGLPNAGGTSSALFLAGDVRANEQVGLTVMHTLFVREHNRLAEELSAKHPDWTGEQIYFKARQLVGAQMQVITYKEFLPTLLGNPLPPYRGYRRKARGFISNVFSTASYRFGHSALSTSIKRLDAQGNEISYGHLDLRNAFFAPQRLINEAGLEPVLRGLANQLCQAIDPYIIDDVRNFLFGAPGDGGFDLASLNIQRGRDHGIPSYNEVRHRLGLKRRKSFAQITSDRELRRRLSEAYYDDVDDIDLWVGALAEDPLPGGHIGELNAHIIRQQFMNLRDADRYWYSLILQGDELKEVEKTRLSDIIRRNTNIGDELPSNVFQIGYETASVQP